MTHSFRTGPWAKKQTPKTHFRFLLHSTHPQRAFVHEVAHQMLGAPPSALWGVPIPGALKPKADVETLQFVKQAAKHPAHEFGRLISTHKKASGFISSLGDLVSSAGKTVAEYGGKVSRYVIKNGEAIQRGVAIGKDLVQTGATVAAVSGLIHPDTASQIDQIAAAINKHAQGDHYKRKEKKKGGLLIV